MSSFDPFVVFLEEHPEWYPIVSSSIYLLILNFIAQSPKSLTDIQSKYLNIEQKDIQLVVQSLVSLKLVSEIKTTAQLLFKANDNGMLLLQRLKDAKQALSTE
ncbi:MAG: hypothetical protein V1494_02575 [Candidatus Diapherotrites archaeon]